jgi:hypothetical protein
MRWAETRGQRREGGSRRQNEMGIGKPKPKSNAQNDAPLGSHVRFFFFFFFFFFFYIYIKKRLAVIYNRF